MLGLVGPVSVYCDWVRWKVGSATSISVWQHVKRSVLEIHWHVAGTLSNQQTTEACGDKGPRQAVSAAALGSVSRVFFFLAFAGYTMRVVQEMNEAVFSSSCWTDSMA